MKFSGHFSGHRNFIKSAGRELFSAAGNYFSKFYKESSTMKRILFLFFILVLVGCEAIPIKKSGEIHTKNTVKPTLHPPVDVTIAFYVDRHKPEQGVNFYGKMKEAAKLVTAEFFKGNEELKSDSNFQYLLIIKSSSDWDRMWGNWNSLVSTEILNNQGELLFSKNSKISSESSNLYDFNAVFNSFAKSLKEDIIMFLNEQGPEQVQLAEADFSKDSQATVSIKQLIKNIKPS
jgi:serine protease Do